MEPFVNMSSSSSPSSFWAEVAQNLSGGLSAGTLVSAFIFVLIGVVLNIWIDVGNRNPDSLDKPEEFDFWWFAGHNKRRLVFNIIASFLFAYCLIVFFPSLFSGSIFKMMFAVGIGLLSDQFCVAARQIQKALGKWWRRYMKKFE